MIFFWTLDWASGWTAVVVGCSWSWNGPLRNWSLAFRMCRINSDSELKSKKEHSARNRCQKIWYPLWNWLLLTSHHKKSKKWVICCLTMLAFLIFTYKVPVIPCMRNTKLQLLSWPLQLHDLFVINAVGPLSQPKRKHFGCTLDFFFLI